MSHGPCATSSASIDGAFGTDAQPASSDSNQALIDAETNVTDHLEGPS